MKNRNAIGARVRLSEFGREMQRPHKKAGTVTGRLPQGTNDYLVAVKWDGDRAAAWMHEHQVELANA